MIVTIVSESTNKARKTVRRILSSYLSQVGQDVWTDHISEIGLKEIESKLKEKASKFMAVICHRHRGLKPPVVEWRVGKTDMFDEDGRFSFRQKKVKFTYQYEQNKELMLLSIIVALAALTHDLGKATLGFQKKLNAAIDSLPSVSLTDTVRHELISLFILKSLFKLFKEKNSFDVFENPEDVTRFFDSIVITDLQLLKDEYVSLKTRILACNSWKEKCNAVKTSVSPINFSDFESEPIMTTWAWLVLTHHKMITTIVKSKNGIGRRQVKSTELSISSLITKHINISNVENISDFFVIDTKKTLGNPWHDKTWNSRIITLLKRLEKSKKNVSKIDLKKSNPWISAMMYMARPSIIFGDHTASFDSEVIEHEKLEVYANTKNGKMADGLAKHLLKAEWQSSRFFNVLFRKNNDKMHMLPKIKRENYPSTFFETTTTANFIWQNSLSGLQEVKEAEGLLCVMMPNTGTGKTKGSLVAAAFAGEELRCCVALGLKTLAEQSFDAYTKVEIGLSPDDVELIIGSHYPIEEKEEQPGSGISASKGKALLKFKRQKGKETIEYLGMERLIKKGKMSAMISSPVTVMTIDHIINAVSLKKGSDTHVLYHLMHSDLILDEIDNFSPCDLVFVEMLVFIMALYGRKVILSSATVNKVIVQAMSKAYEKGWATRSHFYGEKKAHFALVASSEPYMQITELGENNKNEYKDFVKNLAPKRDTIFRHKPVIIDVVSTSRNRDEAYQKMFACAKKTQEYHNTDINGLSYSTGFVRFNNVSGAQDFSVWLSNQDHGDTHVEIICYHARTNTMERSIQEYVLKDLVNRKSEPTGMIKTIRDELLGRARNAGKKKCMLLVATTSIIEVGRDHCYDWCIMEPSTLASYIQAIGRILRHLFNKIVSSMPNILILDEPLKKFEDEEKIWQYPGVETPGFFEQDEYGNPNRGKDVLPPYYLHTKQTASSREKLNLLEININADENGERIYTAKQMLGDAIAFPHNSLVLSTPDSFTELPEHSLKLMELQDHLISGFYPLKKTNELFNAGNIIDADEYKLAAKLGEELKFRHGQKTFSLMCQTDAGHYRNAWVIQNDKGNMQPHDVQGYSSFNESAFLMSHVDRKYFINNKQDAFSKVDPKIVFSSLYSIDVPEYNKGKAMRFNYCLGLLDPKVRY